MVCQIQKIRLNFTKFKAKCNLAKHERRACSMVHLVGARGTGKDDQEVLRRNMAPRLQSGVAFGVLTASVSLGSILQPKVS